MQIPDQQLVGLQWVHGRRTVVRLDTDEEYKNFFHLASMGPRSENRG